jgi:hypothetical protein
MGEEPSREAKKNLRSLRILVIAAAMALAGCAARNRTKAGRPPAPPPSPAAPSCTMTVEPSSIQTGQSVALTWTSQNATGFDLQPGVGKQQTSGSAALRPAESIIYIGTVTGPGGSNTCTAQVIVQLRKRVSPDATSSAPPPPPPAPSRPPVTGPAAPVESLPRPKPPVAGDGQHA